MHRFVTIGLFSSLFAVAAFIMFWQYSNNNSIKSAFAIYEFVADNGTSSTSASSAGGNESVSSPVTGSSASTNGTLLYEFPGIGLKVQYPSTWEKVEYGRAMKALGEGVVANLLSPLEGSSDKFRDYVLLKVENLTSSELGKMPANNSIAGGATYLQVFDHPNLANQSDTITTMQEWTSQNGKAFVVEFTAEKGKFAHYLPLAKEIINSIELNGVSSSSGTPANTPSHSSSLSPSQSGDGTTANNGTTMSGNKTQMSSSIIEKLLKRDIDKNETSVDPLSDNKINAP